MLAPLVSIALSVFSSVAPATLGLPRASDRVEGWRSDLEFVVSEARRVHASPARPAHSDEFAAMAQELSAAIPELTDGQVLVGLMRLVALLGDGHSSLFGPDSDTPLEFDPRTLPFKMYAFPSGLYVVDGVGEYARYAGSRIVRFGELSADEVMDRMEPLRGVDNAVTWLWLGPEFYVRQLALLAEIGVSVNDGQVEMTLLPPGGVELTLAVTGGLHEVVRKLRPRREVSEPPLWLSDVDTNLWMSSMPERGAIYVQFNQVRSAPVQIPAFSAELRTALMEEGADTLIVDVRHNNGGNNTLLRPLVRAMIEFEMRSKSNRIFVLMGRGTFSAAQNFINRVERWTNATFVGEPTSSCPNFVGETNEFVLPYSRVRGSISNRFWQDSDPWDDRAWIEPDIAIELTAEDYFSGVDPVLARVLDRL